MYIYTFKYHVYAPMGRFQLELIYYFAYFSTVVPSNICVFLSCKSFVENVVLTTKDQQERNTQMLDGTTVTK